nr:hypothetical protein [Paracoccus saliphilus]
MPSVKDIREFLEMGWFPALVGLLAGALFLAADHWGFPYLSGFPSIALQSAAFFALCCFAVVVANLLRLPLYLYRKIFAWRHAKELQAAILRNLREANREEQYALAYLFSINRRVFMAPYDHELVVAIKEKRLINMHSGTYPAFNWPHSVAISVWEEMRAAEGHWTIPQKDLKNPFYAQWGRVDRGHRKPSQKDTAMVHRRCEAFKESIVISTVEIRKGRVQSSLTAPGYPIDTKIDPCFVGLGAISAARMKVATRRDHDVTGRKRTAASGLGSPFQQHCNPSSTEGHSWRNPWEGTAPSHRKITLPPSRDFKSRFHRPWHKHTWPEPQGHRLTLPPARPASAFPDPGNHPRVCTPALPPSHL